MGLPPVYDPRALFVYRHGPTHDERRHVFALPTHNQAPIVDALSRDGP